ATRYCFPPLTMTAVNALSGEGTKGDCTAGSANGGREHCQPDGEPGERHDEPPVERGGRGGAAADEDGCERDGDGGAACRQAQEARRALARAAAATSRLRWPAGTGLSGKAGWVAASSASSAAAVAKGGRRRTRPPGRMSRSRRRPARSGPPLCGSSAQAEAH